MRQEEIQKRLNKELSEFQNAKYEGELPPKFMKYFENVIFSIAPSKASFSPTDIKDWLSKQLSDLTRAQVSLMVEMIVNVPTKDWCPSMEEYLSEEVGPLLLEIFVKCQKEFNDFNEKQNKKRIAWTHETGTKKEKQPKKNKKNEQTVEKTENPMQAV